MKSLVIYYENQEVATLGQDEYGMPELEYTKNWQRNGFDISVTLPRLNRRHTGPMVQAFFENILPEGPIHQILAKKLGHQTIIFQASWHTSGEIAPELSASEDRVQREPTSPFPK